jgi:hypothetical protein
MTQEPRGIRNNNPGNIRHGQPWQGLASTQTDSSFDQFVSAQYGIRAIMKIMMTYHNEGLDTIEKIINKWAPTNENNTSAYVAAVATAVNISPTAAVDIHDTTLMADIIGAIIMHENGQQPYSIDLIIEGINLAL